MEHDLSQSALYRFACGQRLVGLWKGDIADSESLEPRFGRRVPVPKLAYLVPERLLLVCGQLLGQSQGFLVGALRSLKVLGQEKGIGFAAFGADGLKLGKSRLRKQQRQTENPKSESRNSKQIRMTKLEMTETPEGSRSGQEERTYVIARSVPAMLRLGHLDFGFWICFEFRDSDFGFGRPIPPRRYCP
jgi:hypothetical protein